MPSKRIEIRSTKEAWQELHFNEGGTPCACEGRGSPLSAPFASSGTCHPIMSAPRCPFCGTPSPDAAAREQVPGGDSSFICRNCGKAVEPPVAGKAAPAPPQNAGSSDRWSAGPPEESANRWSTQAPLGDESSSSESVSQSSILPDGDLEPPLLVRPPAAPLTWALIVLAIFLAALIGVIVLARSIRRAAGRCPASDGRILAAATGPRRRRDPA